MPNRPSESNSFISKGCLNLTVYLCTCNYTVFLTRHMKLSSFLLPLQGKEGAVGLINTLSQSSAEARERSGHSHGEPWD